MSRSVCWAVKLAAGVFTAFPLRQRRSSGTTRPSRMQLARPRCGSTTTRRHVDLSGSRCTVPAERIDSILEVLTVATEDDARQALSKPIAVAASETKAPRYLAQLAYAYSCVVVPGNAGAAAPSDEQ